MWESEYRSAVQEMLSGTTQYVGDVKLIILC